MKILLVNHKMRYPGGTESYTYALGGQLIKRGHRVDLFTFRKGLISNQMERDLGIRTVDVPRGKYDVVLASHNTMVQKIFSHKTGFIIQTCHGTYNKLEQPSAYANAHVAISKEVGAHLHRITKIVPPVILNGIDCSRFAPVIPIKEKPRKVLSLVHNDRLNDLLQEQFGKYRIQLTRLNKRHPPVILNEAQRSEGSLQPTHYSSSTDSSLYSE